MRVATSMQQHVLAQMPPLATNTRVPRLIACQYCMIWVVKLWSECEFAVLCCRFGAPIGRTRCGYQCHRAGLASTSLKHLDYEVELLALIWQLHSYIVVVWVWVVVGLPMAFDA
jgi:hypothetical protein